MSNEYSHSVQKILNATTVGEGLSAMSASHLLVSGDPVKFERSAYPSGAPLVHGQTASIPVK